MKRFFSLPVLLLSLLSCAERASGPDGPYSWGDTGDGRYRNPVLLADYSDPDAIRVGDRYYLVASDFHFMGMQEIGRAHV